MKKLLLLSAIAALAFIPADKTLTREERSVAVKNLEDSRDALIKDVKGLSDAQLHFKTAPDRWSVAECVEHIALAESKIFQLVNMTLQAPADPSKRDSVKVTDQQLLASLVDRSHKSTAPEMLKPTGSFKSTADALDSFVTWRNLHIEYIKNTSDDLRDHYFRHPAFGLLDSYQWVLLIAGHSRRHTLQLEEVMADPNFPKN
jgi:hypothetical protein